MKEIKQFLKTNSTTIINELANQNIIWHFIPPKAPNFGGIWEAAVKSAKTHFKRVTGGASLTVEEFVTLMVGIEGVLNSRPLFPMSSDPNDLEPLTPAHFLIGRPITASPEILTRRGSSQAINFKHLQELQRHFWSRWSREYLVELQRRSKWFDHAEPIKVGTLVVIKEDNLPSHQWKMGRVTKIHPGADGTVRVVTLRTATGS